MEQITFAKNNNQPCVPNIQTKYCLYARKSTEAEDKQALSIESQIKEMLAVAERENLEIIEIKKESHSSKEVGQREIFNQMIKEIREGKYNGILTWAPDRLSRNAGDLGSIVDLMDQKLLIEIRTYGQKFTNNPNEKFLLMILCSQAKLENDNKAVNVKRGLKARCEMGLRPSVAPTGYLSEKRIDKKCQVKLDPKRAPMIKEMFEKIGNEQWSGRKVHRYLRDAGFKTKNNKFLVIGNIYLILRNPFYYGEFEYPVNSGNWYVGQHVPIITKELYDRVQLALNQKYIPKTESKEFAFTKLIKCGHCGSGITADEKFKKLKNGTVTRHIYYHCNRSKDRGCKCCYITEEELLKQFEQLLDKIDLDEIGMKEKIDAEINKYRQFSYSVLGKETEFDNKTINADIRNYVKHVINKGTRDEKREILGCLKSKIVLINKKIYLDCIDMI